jgi:hypothetical protein
MHKSIVLTQNSRISVRVIDLGRKPGVLIYLWGMEEYTKPTTERRKPLQATSLIQAKPSWRSEKMVPGSYVLESTTSERCFEIQISPER